ncbi:tetratricopeptide repeat protein [Sinosporangium siamense]|uniref:tetratricopeptide repeat protein n=1 Tax=Sinosporangium siamense TaxID=1367973 RepID=UPI001EF271C8|nr:tetratricopeptide repeat protein [Sinosporangium siamense]
MEELQRILTRRRMSWRKLAEMVGYDPSWLSKVKNGWAAPSPDLVRRCDEALEAGGALLALGAAGQTRRPAQLPAPPGGFIGRGHELLRIHDALVQPIAEPESIIVAIDGPPGVGKTSLALRCAHDALRMDPQRYPDGQLYVNLRGYTSDEHPFAPGRVLEEFLLALGVPAQDIPPEEDHRARLYRSVLASRQMLIVLDNAATSRQVEPLLPGTTTCGVVITSRRRLTALSMRVTVERIELGPMSDSESVQVLNWVIGKSRVDTAEHDLATLARWCGGLPLALRIVAERVSAHRHHSLGDLIEELASERQRLDALATEESIAIRTAFAWSYRDLNPRQALLFHQLSLHRGPHISAEATSALAGLPVVRARRLLGELTAVHLLESAPHGRYHFHDLIRVYAAERLEADSTPADRNEVVRRLTDWYLHTAYAGSLALAPFRLSPLTPAPPCPGVTPLRFDSEQAALAWYDLEAPNFVPIIRLAIDYQLYQTAWQTAIALFDYLRLLRTSGGLWLATSTLAEKAAIALGDRRAHGWVTTSLAEAYRWLHQYERAHRVLEQSLALQQEIGDRHGQAWASAVMGFVAVDCGRLHDAHTYAGQALALFEEAGDRHGQASALFTLADAYHGWERPADTMKVLTRSLNLFQAIGNHDGQGLALAKIADTHAARGDHERALECLDLSLQARRLAGSRWGEADALARRGRTLEALGREEEARVAWREALALYEDVDDPRAREIRDYLDGSVPTPGGRVLTRPAW